MWGSSSLNIKQRNENSGSAADTKFLMNDYYDYEQVRGTAAPSRKMSSLPASPYACYYYNNNPNHDNDDNSLLLLHDNNEWNMRNSNTASINSGKPSRSRRLFKQQEKPDSSPTTTETSYSSSASSVGEKQSLHCSLMSRFFKFGRKRNNNTAGSNNNNGSSSRSNSPFDYQRQHQRAITTKTAGIRNRISRSFSFHNNNSSTNNASKSHFYYKIEDRGHGQGCYRSGSFSMSSSTTATPSTDPKFKQQHPDSSQQQHHQQNGYALKTSSPGRPLGPIQLQDPKSDVDDTYAVPTSPASEDLHRTLRLRTILLEERLRVMEGITGNLANCRIVDKNEYENCMSELTSQVSRAVTLQQIMKNEVEKLNQRVLELETSNNTIASMIVPTLMKLEETIGNTNNAQRDGRGQGIAVSCNQFNGRRSMSSDNNNRRLGDSAEIEVGSSSGGSSWKNNRKSKIDYGHIQSAVVTRRTNSTNINSNNRQVIQGSPKKNLSPSASQRQQQCIKVNNNGTRERESKENRDEGTEGEKPSLSTPISANSLKAQLLSSVSSSSNPNKSFNSSNNSAINSGRLSPFSKSESSSISRSSNNAINGKRLVASSSAKHVSQVGAIGSPAKKSSTYSGIPRMSSVSKNNSNKSSRNNGLNSSPSKLKSSLPTSNSSPLSIRKANASSRNGSSPSRDLHSRLPVLKKNSSQKKPSSSSDDDNLKKCRLPISTNVSTPNASTSNNDNLLNSKETTATYSNTEKAFLSNSVVLQVEEELIPPITIKDEGYSTMSSEALAEQESNSTNNTASNKNGMTLILNKADEIISNGVVEDDVNEENDRSQKEVIEKGKSNNFGMRKSSTVNTFLPIRIISSNSTSPAEQRKGMMLRDERRRQALVLLQRTHNNKDRDCDDEVGDDDNDNDSKSHQYSSSLSGKTRLMTEIASTSLPTTSTRQKKNKNMKRNYYYEAGDEQEDENDEEHLSIATSTILWEDSDDSDILFLPLEMSSGAVDEGEDIVDDDQCTNSSSTLVPITSSMSDQSYNSTTTNSTLTGQDSTQQHNYPLRRTKGEEFVALLSSKLVHHQRYHPRYFVEQEPAEDEIEEKALIEKWMKLEDVRSQVQTEEEWAWDWDGVERTKQINPLVSTQVKQVPVTQFEQKVANDDNERSQEKDAKPNGKAITASSTLSKEKIKGSVSKTNKSKLFEAGSSRTFTRDEVSIIKSVPIDTNTWTKPKSFLKIAQEAQAKQEAKTSPKKKRAKCQSHSQIQGEKKESKGKEKLEKVLVEFENDSSSSLIKVDKLSEEQHEQAQPETEEGNSSPPAIEFTPEYYHLVNLTKNYETVHAGESIGENADELDYQMMDDKISQTDFGSLETLSISSELFSECRNCLELIKRLVGNENDEEGEVNGVSDPGMSVSLRRMKHECSTELGAHEGSPTTWVSVPKGVSNTEVNRILEILSSSESEDILSPGK